MTKERIYRLLLFAFFVLSIWFKTYWVQKNEFHLDIENEAQGWILLLSPLSSAILLLGAGMFFKRWGIVLASLLASVILYANMLYYRFFNDFITLPVLFQTSNAADLGSSVTELTKGTDILYFLDPVVLVFLLFYKKMPKPAWKKSEAFSVLCVAVMVFMVNLGFAEKERPQLLTRSFDRSMLIKNIGTYNYLIYDGYLQSKTKTQKAFADTSEIVGVANYLNGQKVQPNEHVTGIAKGKNLIVVSFESLQNFVIDQEIDGQPITPFLNELKQESFYFPNFYHQTAQGKTSDSEFLLENSLYPLPRGSVFFTHGQNSYYSMPQVLGENGYFTGVFHANDKSFWNRDVMYKSLDYQKYYSKSSYDINENNSIGWGLKDDDFFKQSIPYLKEIKQPYYAKFITLTNHFPFTLSKEDEYIPEWTSGDGTVNRYFTTVRYTDEALKNFFQDMKESGLYENSIFVIYGDHYGISENHNEAMGQFLGKDINDFETLQLQKVPLIIHIPGTKGYQIDKVGGQIDLRPTILNLLGIKEANPITFGSDLLSEDKPSYVISRDGSFVTSNLVWTRGSCYEKATGNEIEKSHCKPYTKKADEMLKYSDQVIYGDLLRFLPEILDTENQTEQTKEKDSE